MPLTLPAAPTPPTLTNPATFEADCSAYLAWMAAIATAMTGKALLVADILGTVSQSGGVPTGAIMERGVNANGTYVRFADGTQICTISPTGVNIAANSNYLFAWTFPAAFATGQLPAVLVTPWSYNDEAGAIAAVTHLQSSYHAPSVASAVLVTRNSYSSAVYGRSNAVAIGRWF